VSTALKDRLKQAADGVQSFGGRDVQATTVKDARGEWAKATGTAIIGGRTIHVTVMNLAGKSSLLYLMGGTEKAEDQVRFDHMVQSVTAKANK
jgi:ABC-type cobalamin transport system ATPase subunit